MLKQKQSIDKNDCSRAIAQLLGLCTFECCFQVLVAIKLLPSLCVEENATKICALKISLSVRDEYSGSHQGEP